MWSLSPSLREHHNTMFSWVRTYGTTISNNHGQEGLRWPSHYPYVLKCKSRLYVEGLAPQSASFYCLSPHRGEINSLPVSSSEGESNILIRTALEGKSSNVLVPTVGGGLFTHFGRFTF